MTKEQARAQIRGLRFAPSTVLGYTSASLRIAKRSTSGTENLRGLDYVFLEFLDGRLTGGYFVYDSTVDWPTAAQFAQRVSEALKVPHGWERIGEFQFLRCGNVVLLTGLSLINYKEHPVLSWRDSSASVTLSERKRKAEEREKQKEEERRRSFKP